MKIFNFTVLLVISTFSAGFGQPQRENSNRTINNNVNQSQVGLEHIALYDSYSSYCNNLSTIATDVNFIQLASKPLLNDFLIHDIQFCDNYIFVSGMKFIYQYNDDGSFIKSIGNYGKGPGEFLNLFPPLQIDQTNKLIYVLDIKFNSIYIYNFNNKLIRKFSIGSTDDGGFNMIDSNMLVIKQGSFQRIGPNCKAIRFIDTQGKKIKDYKSHIYPILRNGLQRYGSDTGFLWENNGLFYTLEYGSDTIFQINKSQLIPARVLNGSLKQNKNELFYEKNPANYYLASMLFRPHSAIFETNRQIIFRIWGSGKSYFAIYNKQNKRFEVTDHKNTEKTKSGMLKMDYFIDDTYTGLRFNPLYQTNNWVMALIPALEICENRQKILTFIAKHPTQKSEYLLKLVKNMNEMDNPVLMSVKFR